MSDRLYDAVIFDLDGVITRTASVHSAAWKQMFDEFLRAFAARHDEPFREFRHNEDYLPYVDGKPRYEGVASFLESRGTFLPFGDPADDPGQETICGLGNRKNSLFNQRIAQGELDVYDSTVAFIRALKEMGVRLGVASSSKNAEMILNAAGLADLFETRVDGVVSAELGLKGKPEPDIFTTACDNLGVPYDRAIVVEDAVSGVKAARSGNFGLVLGIARQENEQDLRLHGADLVVEDLNEITLRDLDEWFSKGLEDDSWSLSYFDYSREEEGTRESLCTVGNGYFGTRGALEECEQSEVNYPGTYIAGLFNRLISKVAGREITNEDLVNCPNWLPLTFRIGDEAWFDPNDTEWISFRRTLDFRTGVLSRRMVVKDVAGRKNLVESWRLASMAHPHLASLRYRITPLNYAGRISFRCGLDGRVENAGVERYRQLNSKHLHPVAEGGTGETAFILLQTSQSHIQIAEACKLVLSCNGSQTDPAWTLEKQPGAIYTTIELDVEQGIPVTVDKMVALYTSSDKGIEDPLQAALTALRDLRDFGQLQQDSAAAWEAIWNDIDIRIEGDRLSQKLIRLHLYHTLATASPHNVDIDAGIPARGLHGEAYRGHIFWDTVYVLPFHAMHFPEIAKSALLYRYRRLDQARAYAATEDCRGAMFPWQSGSEGREETQLVHLNPLSGEWGSDLSSRQRHVSLAIAYDLWTYFHITSDLQFMEAYGAEMLLEICRFWADKARFDPQTSRYSIEGVMGPDEYHEKYPGAETGGLKDNSYTNVMMVWAFHRASDVFGMLSDKAREALMEKIHFSEGELERWKTIATRIHVPISEDGIMEQFDGYFNLKELDWQGHRERYGDIARLDRILKAEGTSPDTHKASKQADALMAFYLLAPPEVTAILNGAGYAVRSDVLRRNFDYYFQRTSHGSTLSILVHSYLAILLGDVDLGWQLYRNALLSDYHDVQGGTTKEGIHAGVMTGTVLVALRAFAGLDLSGEDVRITPRLPASWRRIRFSFGFRQEEYHIMISREKLELMVESDRGMPIQIWVDGRRRSLVPQKWEVMELTRGGA